jgi:hypothetical protein
MSDGPVTYDPATDTMLVELRPWPGGAAISQAVGGEDAGDDLVIHHAPDGSPWAWEVEHASRHPDLVAGTPFARCGRPEGWRMPPEPSANPGGQRPAQSDIARPRASTDVPPSRRAAAAG